MSEIRKSLDENFKDLENKEDQLILNPNINYGKYNDCNQQQNKQFNNIQDPVKNIQMYPNSNEISEPYLYENNKEDKTSQQNKNFLPPPFVNNENNQQKIEINQNRNGNFQNNQIGNNYNNPYPNYQRDYQPNIPPNNDIQIRQKAKPCCGPLECLAVLAGCIFGFLAIIILPNFFSIIN